ncbi:hypothetical protein N7462_002971 [Penicillium macrosclerotiorum]|uniref:uncharacterized protein n=1 Tax=Penicillium macrosclerotiorum TaxID=303699 RepID=UPI002548DBEA|nr:uncharacterized protein N7462_002971 [Penicillium macrosclerotiorum]KAJ5688579.1 hypothetical protein N7462_002971 [Penicillium macrosclerotiorum]
MSPSWTIMSGFETSRNKFEEGDGLYKQTVSEARPRELQQWTNREVPMESTQPVRAEISRLLLSAMLRYVIFVRDEARAQLLPSNAKCNKSFGPYHPAGNSSTQEPALLSSPIAFFLRHASGIVVSSTVEEGAI